MLRPQPPPQDPKRPRLQRDGLAVSAQQPQQGSLFFESASHAHMLLAQEALPQRGRLALGVERLLEFRLRFEQIPEIRPQDRFLGFGAASVLRDLERPAQDGFGHGRAAQHALHRRKVGQRRHDAKVVRAETVLRDLQSLTEQRQ